jgi:hypothetical protein
MNDAYQQQTPTIVIPMGVQQLLRIVIIGAGIGLITWGLTFLLDGQVFKSIACRSGAPMQCASSLDYASAVAGVVGAALGLLVLVKLQVFRSLLVVLAVSVSMWGIQSTVHLLPWQYGLLTSIALFAVAYGLFAWLARIRSFLMTVVIMIVLIVAMRLILNA